MASSDPPLSPMLAPVDRVARELAESLRMVRREGVADEDTLIVGLNFTCNSKCTFCIIEEEIEARHPDTEVAVFDAVFRFNRDSSAFQRLTISGAEATLRSDLAELVAKARTVGGFSHVRIQTNARRLANSSYLATLIDAGLDEYFVSVHAHDQATSLAITRRHRAFDELLAGLTNLRAEASRVALITNTVVNRDNVSTLPAIARFLVEQGVTRAELWNFLEIGEAGQTEYLVPVAESAVKVIEALDILLAGGVHPVVKWFPRCLLGRHAGLLDNHQPPMLIRDSFQRRLSHNFGFSCVHRAACADPCDGLHERYIAVFGDERDVLQPLAARIMS